MAKPITATLYGGEVSLSRAANHIYRVRTEGGKSFPVPNVTSIIGMMDKSRALLPWQANVISHVVGEEVNKLISSLPAAGQRFTFTENAHSKFVAGLTALKRRCTTATNDIRDTSADEGKVIHRWIEDFFEAREAKRKSPPTTRHLSGGARRACKLFAQWAVDNDVRPVAVERLVFSRKHFFVGQTDLILRVGDKVGVWDVKTGKNLYDSVLMQTAAYKEAWSEEANHVPSMQPIDGPGGALLFFREDIDPVTKVMTGDFAAVPFTEQMLDGAFDAFKGCLTLKKWSKNSWKELKDAVAAAT